MLNFVLNEFVTIVCVTTVTWGVSYMSTEDKHKCLKPMIVDNDFQYMR